MKQRKSLLAFILYGFVFFLLKAAAVNFESVACKPQLNSAGDATPSSSSSSSSYASSRETDHSSWWVAANSKLHRLWNRHRHRLSRVHATPELAYRMMVMATMSYWEFHKHSLPSNTTGFTLRPPQTTKARVTGRKRKFIRKQIRKVRRSVAILLQRGTIFPPVYMDGFRRRHNVASPSNTDENSHRDDKDRLTFVYWLFDWYETGLAKARFHDTDVLIAYGPYDDSLVISFGGTSSAADAVTNIQTFEPANHSGFYHGGHGGAGMRSRIKEYLNLATANITRTLDNTVIQGSLHRGFLNAYARVDRGSVLRLCQKDECNDDQQPLALFLSVLHEQFGNCTLHLSKPEKRKGTGGKTETPGSEEDSDSGDSDDQQTCSAPNCPSITVRPRRKGDGCFVKGKRLSTILQELTSAALRQGRTVHLTGHSLGGGLASHLALDLVINFPDVPVNKLHLWTFGAPQICDALFLTSAVSAAPRLGPFVENPDSSISVVGRLHRYVTLSDACEVDAVSEVAKRTLPAHEPKGIRRLLARSLGGVHDHIVHFVEPHYLLTPQQEFRMTQPPPTTANTGRNRTKTNDAEGPDVRRTPKDNIDASPIDETKSTRRTTKSRKNFKGGEKEHSTPSPTTSPTTNPGTTTTRGSSTSSTTHSAVAAHACVNYLLGTSRESTNHPLQTDLPLRVREWLGEDVVLLATSSYLPVHNSNDSSSSSSSRTAA